ncbi:hypothetical protein [Spirulina sp. 06S082]|uniref:hypothetical protein n=1 Tax=Spirulina sp. 06S082 TaxID=3110248 RepID=UPI002B20F60F|nr:hypothetical protein [Spirulina sp. 06S082]MEA5467985.1 hypothetical protein [Spirulina sp. 06S082]
MKKHKCCKGKKGGQFFEFTFFIFGNSNNGSGNNGGSGDGIINPFDEPEDGYYTLIYFPRILYDDYSYSQQVNGRYIEYERKYFQQPLSTICIDNTMYLMVHTESKWSWKYESYIDGVQDLEGSSYDNSGLSFAPLPNALREDAFIPAGVTSRPYFLYGSKNNDHVSISEPAVLQSWYSIDPNTGNVMYTYKHYKTTSVAGTFRIPHNACTSNNNDGDDGSGGGDGGNTPFPELKHLPKVKVCKSINVGRKIWKAPFHINNLQDENKLEIISTIDSNIKFTVKYPNKARLLTYKKGECGCAKGEIECKNEQGKVCCINCCEVAEKLYDKYSRVYS